MGADETSAMTIGELKDGIQGVPDDYLCTIELEGLYLNGVKIKDEKKEVDFYY